MAHAASHPDSDRPDAGGDVDTLLSQVSSLTGEIAHQVGAATSPAALDDEIEAELSSLERSESLAADSSESTTAAGAVAVAPPDAPQTATKPARGKVVQLGKSTAKPRPPAEPAPEPEKAAAPPAERPPPEQPWPAAPPPPPQDVMESAPRAAPRAIQRAVSLVCHVLDAFDRRLQWCGPRVRDAAGWAALALGFAALCLFVLSFVL